MTREEFQTRAQALLDSWTNSGSEMRNTTAWRDAVAAELLLAYADGQAAMSRYLTDKPGLVASSAMTVS